MAEICGKCAVIFGRFFDKESQKTGKKRLIKGKRTGGGGARTHAGGGMVIYMGTPCSQRAGWLGLGVSGWYGRWCGWVYLWWGGGS